MAFSKDQLAWIGAAVMAYNDAETNLQDAFTNCADFPFNSNDLVLRIGIGNLPTLVLDAVKRIVDDKKIHALAQRTLIDDGGFTQLKTYRDGIVHARLWDMHSAIAVTPNKGKPDSVLLSSKALEGVYHRLQLIVDELLEITTIISCSRSLKQTDVQTEARLAQHKEQLAQSIQAATVRLIQLQKRRRSLPSLPAFPPGSLQVPEEDQGLEGRLAPTLL